MNSAIIIDGKGKSEFLILIVMTKNISTNGANKNMKAYIFACNYETMKECFSRSLFGVSKSYVKDIKIGDYCYLYNYEVKLLYGVWKATSRCGWHEQEAWGGKYKYQARVERVSKSLHEVPLSSVANIIQVGGNFTWVLYGDKAENLIQYFAHQYDTKVQQGKNLNEIEEDYRKRYPKNYICEDGHQVRSLSEQTIDNWLYRHGVTHSYEPVISIPEELIPDFSVTDSDGKTVYIEFWGMPNDPSYKARMLKKTQIYLNRNFPLIELQLSDLQNLDYIFPKKLMRKNVRL